MPNDQDPKAELSEKRQKKGANDTCRAGPDSIDHFDRRTRGLPTKPQAPTPSKTSPETFLEIRPSYVVSQDAKGHPSAMLFDFVFHHDKLSKTSTPPTDRSLTVPISKHAG